MKMYCFRKKCKPAAWTE